VDSLFLVLRVAVSLAAVLGLLWYLQRRFAGRLGVHQRGDVAVLSRTPLGAKSQAVVLEAHGRRYLLGVTEHGVNVLDDDLPLAPEPEDQDDDGRPARPGAVPFPWPLEMLPPKGMLPKTLPLKRREPQGGEPKRGRRAL
jgi:flagellar biogenesis protein FliO